LLKLETSTSLRAIAKPPAKVKEFRVRRRARIEILGCGSQIGRRGRRKAYERNAAKEGANRTSTAVPGDAQNLENCKIADDTSTLSGSPQQ